MAGTDRGLIAVLDIGKSNAKLTLTEWDSGAVVWAAETPTAPVQRGPVRDLGAEASWAWLLRSLKQAPQRERIGAIVPVAHGAAVALLDDRRELICAPDYEDPAPDAISAAYAGRRDPFAITFSPAATRGLAVGRQLFFLQEAAPALFATVRHVLPYPQYWAWKLSGVLASEATSLGAHTDLWLPEQACFSPLAEREGWSGLFPGLRRASDRLGSLRPELARELGLDGGCAVFCGIHDSNASYLAYRAVREAPFVLVSSGTWTIVMAHGADLRRLREAQDMLANVDAFGTPVGTARFMGGREYAAVAGPDAPPPEPGRVREVVAQGAMALPSFALGGPFAGQTGRLVDADGLDGAGRAALAGLYVALVTDTMLDLLGVRAEVIVDGPLAQNAAFIEALACLRPADALRVTAARAGILAGARRLVRGAEEPPPVLRDVRPGAVEGLDAYRAAWRRLAAFCVPPGVP